MRVRLFSTFPTDPEPERRARIQVRLNQLGEGPAALFHDLCLLLDEDLGLEARPMLVSHLLRELESSVREVLRPRRVDIAEETADAASESEKVGTGKEHQRQIDAVLDAFSLDRGGAAGTAWYKVAKDQHGLAHAAATPQRRAGGPTKPT
ncbi:hypothetical protein [Streptomyces sp. CA-106131]|uniref:hypothetical protein n=1 Tax=Streptomyces sp. CA-106131 TaxID=3240045 RepID=UPI003D8B7D6C